MVTIGLKIKELRTERHMTQIEFAERLGVTKSAISSYENGSRLPSYDILLKMARIFKVSTDTLLGNADENAITLDILAGCSGYINALDIARLYISGGIAKKALVVGVDILSKFIDKEDIGTAVVLSDGAGAILLEESDEEKMYFSQIDGNIDKNKILTCKSNEKIQMKGKEVYKYAVTKTVENINKLLEKANLSLDDIKYIVPHQSNLKIINGITSRLKIDENKIYKNIKDVGNTFCGSLPIAINQMKKENLLKNKDKIILLRVWRRSKYRKYFIRNII